MTIDYINILYFRIEKAEEVMSTFESLNYRERAIVADHLGFCRDCYTTHYYDENDLDSEGKPKRKPRRKVPFIELAVEHGLASPDTADRTYRKVLQKMHQNSANNEKNIYIEREGTPRGVSLS